MSETWSHDTNYITLILPQPFSRKREKRTWTISPQKYQTSNSTLYRKLKGVTARTTAVRTYHFVYLASIEKSTLVCRTLCFTMPAVHFNGDVSTLSFDFYPGRFSVHKVLDGASEVPVGHQKKCTDDQQHERLHNFFVNKHQWRSKFVMTTTACTIVISGYSVLLNFTYLASYSSFFLSPLKISSNYYWPQ